MDCFTSGCRLLQNSKLFSAGGFVGSVTSVVLAELSLSQLSHTAGSFDPGGPPLHSRLCRVSIQEAPGVQTLSGTRVLGLTPPSLNHTRDLSCPSCSENKQLRAVSLLSELFSRMSHWFDCFFQSRICDDECTWQFGMATTAFRFHYCLMFVEVAIRSSSCSRLLFLC